MKALRAMIQKEFVHISRDPQLVGFVLALPVLLLILFGYALRLKVDHMLVAVWDQDKTFFSVTVKDRLRNDGQFNVKEVDSEETIRDLLKNGEVRLGLVIPKGFTERLGNNEQTGFPLFVDGTMPTLAQAALYGARVLSSDEAADELTFDDPDHSNDERRFITLGESQRGRVLSVAHADIGEDRTRIISARKVTRREHHGYQEARRSNG